MDHQVEVASVIAGIGLPRCKCLIHRGIAFLHQIKIGRHAALTEGLRSQPCFFPLSQPAVKIEHIFFHIADVMDFIKQGSPETVIEHLFFAVFNKFAEPFFLRRGKAGQQKQQGTAQSGK